MRVKNLGFLTDYGLAFEPDKAAVSSAERILSYAELDARANTVANALLEHGIVPGDRVAILFSNEYRFVEILLGSMRAGAVAVPVNPQISRDTLAFVLADSGARVLIGSAALADLGVVMTHEVACVEVAIVPGRSGPGVVDYDVWVGAAATARPAVTESDVCLQLYTSGSTGRPKGVLLTHAGLLHNADAMMRVMMLGVDDCALVAVPVFHSNALAGSIFPFLLRGAGVAILPGFDPLRVLEAIERYGITYVAGVPAMYGVILAQEAALAATDVSSLEVIVCGSASVSPELLEKLAVAFPRAAVVEVYGLTEGGPAVTATPRYGVRKYGTVGLPLPGISTRIVRPEDGRDVARGAVGELWVKSPGNATGYHNLPELTRERMTAEGWVKTFDLMHEDDDGFLRFVGRLDDMMKVGGNSVYPREVEAVIHKHGDVLEACVVASAHDVKGQVPVAFVVKKSNAACSEQSIREFCLAAAPAYAHPRRVFFLEALPLAGTGKVDRAALAARAAELTSHVG